ncbi:hypothetical protein EHV15_16340 [Paenibacillus oralis]|uniref:Uncharacterized protein n=1 Tax=Paenibacillus oralis TaxID=2490856 RepID=A0A3P3U1U9_9BACL|nr:hypothetical protein [Paenibacillus oralis]RRJ64317.1 hypothetical protein EHV15_16340 [Paenibacillus oralis]
MFARRRAESGAVTVFLIVVFAAIFAFVAIFIDFARMFALQAKAEALAHAAARSVMSSYDRELAERYGLFALGETDSNYIMSKVLQDSFQLAGRSDGLPLLGAKLESSSVEPLRPLGSYAAFERQIQEQMKYRAPIDLTVEILNRFKPMAQVMKEASNTVDLLGKLQKLYDRREAKLDELLEMQRQAARAVEGFGESLPRGSALAIGDKSLGGEISSAADFAAQYDDYEEKVEEDEEREPKKQKHQRKLRVYRSETSGVYEQLDEIRVEAEQRHENLPPQAKALLGEAREINEQMEQTIKEAEHRAAQDGYNEVASGPSTREDGQVGGMEEISRIREQSGSLVLSEELFADLEADIDDQAAAFQQLDGEILSLLATEGAVLSASTSSSTLKGAVRRAGREADKYMRSYVDRGAANVLDANTQLLESHRGSDKERKSAEKAAGAKLKEAAGLIARISELGDKLKAQQERFDQLKADYEANRDMNKAASGGDEAAGAAIDDDPYQAGSSAMAGMDGLYGGLSGLLKGMTDYVFQTEYIVSYFRYLDVSTLDELLQGGPGTDKLDALSDQFAPDRQEAEYILYGFHNPVGNIAAAYGEIFAMRLAIRTMEGFIKNAAKGNPLLVLAAALLYGAEHALSDMLALTRDGKIQLTEYIKVDLTYRDHLRIFLLLHGRSENRLSRMLAVIRMNTGIDTGERATYTSGKVLVSMPLWFLPGVARALGAAGVLKGNVEGSRYYAEKQADFSY